MAKKGAASKKKASKKKVFKATKLPASKATKGPALKPKCNEIIINSLEDLIVSLEQEFKGYDGAIWYRGQSVAGWELVPGYYRITNAPPESTLIKRFRQSAAMLTSAPSIDVCFDWLFLMQHYGVPTRLLDWSESPLVALYFAVDDPDKHGSEDAALWGLRPSELNKNANIIDKEEEFFIPAFEDDELGNYTVKSLKVGRTSLLPVAAIATRNNERIQAQHGVFTIHHHPKTPIENVGDSTHVTKYIIPADKKRHVLGQLQLLGITRFQLFPELASIGHVIKAGLE